MTSPRTDAGHPVAGAPPEPGARNRDRAGEDLPIRDIAAVACLKPGHHVVVLGRRSLSLALALWRAGFVHVGCAPHCVDGVAHGTADALIIDQDQDGPALDRAIARSRAVLQARGWLMIHLGPAAGRTPLPAVKSALEAAGFRLGPGLFGARGLWVTAQRRPLLTLA